MQFVYWHFIGSINWLQISLLVVPTSPWKCFFFAFVLCLKPFPTLQRHSCNISNPTMRTGLDSKSVQFDPWNLVQSELLKMRWINFHPIQGLNWLIYFTRYPVLSREKNKAIWLANLLMNYYWDILAAHRSDIDIL
jgi:hypothetical protein